MRSFYLTEAVVCVSVLSLLHCWMSGCVEGSLTRGALFRAGRSSLVRGSLFRQKKEPIDTPPHYHGAESAHSKLAADVRGRRHGRLMHRRNPMLTFRRASDVSGDRMASQGHFAKKTQKRRRPLASETRDLDTALRFG